MSEERWVVVWKGEDPTLPGRKLDAEGIEMRLAAPNWGAHGGGIGFTILSVIFRRKSGRSRLLVKAEDEKRARALLKGGAP
jgi:hypothetical protein